MAVTNITNVGSLSDDRTVKCNEDHPNVMEAPPVGSLLDDRAENVMEKCNEDHPKRLIPLSQVALYVVWWRRAPLYTTAAGALGGTGAIAN